MKNKLLRNIITIIILITLLIVTNSSAIEISYFQTRYDDKIIKTLKDEYEYYSYQNMTNLLYDLEKNYSEIMSLISLGRTYEGRNIWMIKLSDNVVEKEDEPGVLLIGATHGNEKPSFEMLIFFIKHIVTYYFKLNTDDDNDGLLNEDIIDGFDNDNDGMIDEDPSEERVREVLNNTQIFIIPMLNPDGVEYKTNRYDGWRKNRHYFSEYDTYGVDLNRNYGFKWELYDIFPALYGNAWTSNPESWNYRGEYPFSENETKAVKDLVENNIINISLSYHSYGEFIIYPWMHTSQITPHEDLFISVGEGISNINGYYFHKGDSTLFPWPGGTIGTSENWLYAEQNILSFTIELCEKRVPTNPEVVHNYCLIHVGVNLYVCERAPNIHIEKKLSFGTFFTSYYYFSLWKTLTK